MGEGGERLYRPGPPDLPRAPHKHHEGTASANAVMAHSTMHHPRG